MCFTLSSRPSTALTRFPWKFFTLNYHYYTQFTTWKNFFDIAYELSYFYVGMSGYHFFLISGYLDILDTDFFWILGYLDKWIRGYHGYMDTWIHGYQFSLDIWILGYFGYQFFSLSRFWISYPSIRIFLDNFLYYHKGNQIQVLIIM